MGTTPNRGFRYPETSAQPDIPGDLYKLATDLDTFASSFIQAGNWTPYIGGPNAGNGGSGSLSFGTYAVIGSLVVLSGYVQLGAGGSFGNGGAVIAGLPFNIVENQTVGHGIYIRNSGNPLPLSFNAASPSTFYIQYVSSNVLNYAFNIPNPAQYEQVRFQIVGAKA